MKIFLFFSFVLIFKFCDAQIILFEKKFEFIQGWGRAQGIDTTENGGYIIGSSANFPNVPGLNYLSVTGVTLKVDYNGDTLWKRNAAPYYTIYDDHTVAFNRSYYIQTSFFTGATYTGSNLTDTVYMGIHKLQLDGSLTFSKKYILNGRNSSPVAKSILLNGMNDIIIFCQSINSNITNGQGGG